MCTLSESGEDGWGDGSVRRAVAQCVSLARTPKLSMVVVPVIPVFRRLRQKDLEGSQARESSQISEFSERAYLKNGVEANLGSTNL